MKTINNWFFQTRMSKKITHSLFFGLITTTSLVLSTLSLKAHAQNLSVSNNEVTSYAQSVLAIEPVRQQAFGRIKKIIGSGNIPEILCHMPTSMNNLPGRARDIAIQYCKDSQDIVEGYGLTTEQFNRITEEIPNNNNLKKRVYEQLILIQQKKSRS